MNSVSQSKSFHTPFKEEAQNQHCRDTSDFTADYNQSPLQSKMDYKMKTFKLMKQLTQAEVIYLLTQVLNRKFQTQIRHLEKEIEAYKKQIEKIFVSLGTSNLEEAYKKIEIVLSSDRKYGNEDKMVEWASLIQEYKKIINAQQYKFIKLEQQYKISEVKQLFFQYRLKRYEQQKFQITKQNREKVQEGSSKYVQELKVLKQQKNNQQTSIKSLQQQISILKRQYKQAILDRDNSKQQFEQLQRKYNLQIEHFEQMEKHVEEKLIEVERQMNYYRQEREEHLEKIQLMKKQIDLQQSAKYFSFGGTRNQEIQTEEEQFPLQFNNQCLEISIKTLLEQNERLKNTLITMYSKKSDEELPKEIELQLKILLNMKENNLKSLQGIEGQHQQRRKSQTYQSRMAEAAQESKLSSNNETIREEEIEEEEQNMPEQAATFEGN